jgi:hypothetical protein
MKNVIKQINDFLGMTIGDGGVAGLVAVMIVAMWMKK